MNSDVVIDLLLIGFAVIVAAYIVSLLINKRTLDLIQTTSAGTLAATQNLISQHVYYGAYERSEILRTVASIIGIDQIRDTALEFAQGRQPPYTLEIYPPQTPQAAKQGP